MEDRAGWGPRTPAVVVPAHPAVGSPSAASSAPRYRLAETDNRQIVKRKDSEAKERTPRERERNSDATVFAHC